MRRIREAEWERLRRERIARGNGSKRSIVAWVAVLVGAALLWLYALSEGSSTQTQTPFVKLSLSPSLSHALAVELTNQGFTCPTVREMFFVGQVDSRNEMKVVCTGRGRREFRITARGSGSFTAEAWSDLGLRQGYTEISPGR